MTCASSKDINQGILHVRSESLLETGKKHESLATHSVHSNHGNLVDVHADMNHRWADHFVGYAKLLAATFVVC